MYLTLTNTVALVSLTPHNHPAWQFERKEGNAWIYRRQSTGAVYFFRPDHPRDKKVCQILNATEEYLRFHCSTSEAGRVYVPMNHYPGWQFFVNGNNVDAQTANGFAIWVPVPAGENDVVLQYNPLSFPLGVFLSLGGLFLLIRLYFHN
jgi:hypothetical protein